MINRHPTCKILFLKKIILSFYKTERRLNPFILRVFLWVPGLNPALWPFKWKAFNRTFWWCCLLLQIKKKTIIINLEFFFHGFISICRKYLLLLSIFQPFYRCCVIQTQLIVSGYSYSDLFEMVFACQRPCILVWSWNNRFFHLSDNLKCCRVHALESKPCGWSSHFWIKMCVFHIFRWKKYIKCYQKQHNV